MLSERRRRALPRKPPSSNLMTNPALQPLAQTEDTALRLSDFVDRHIGPRQGEVEQMLDALGVESLDALVDQTIPAAIRLRGRIEIGEGVGEDAALAKLRAIASENVVLRSCLGMGYHPCVVPGVIQRNVLENPAWYTAYTPYQAEIAQGRLEALINFQTMVTDLTGLPVANASLLDEGTAAAEAMRSEERRVGKECRCRWSPYRSRQNCARQTSRSNAAG